MNKLFYFTLFIALLYVIKVQFVVTFINDNMRVAITVWNYLVEASTTLRERHPFVFLSLFFIVFITLIPPVRERE
jgi:hypothetical protein